ncbi:MAG: helix-turn-helix transcriptional regulator [Candidatus Aminicenantes bacterium]|nr:helix-turn-helix transcriptional regulator [Candidatus Aminicenantes bacterium]
MKKLNNNLRRCRFEKNEMTQEECARALGVTRQTIHSIEKGKFIPSTYLAIKISRLFGKSVEDIFFLDENYDDEKKEDK